jgi:hypothetical protein
MTGLAADLTDYVIPFVPVRQFVLSVPHRIRYLLAYDHDRCIAVLRIFIRALMSFYRKRAAKRGVGNGRTGSVTFLQRFGSAANLNIHQHVVVLDGVFTEANGELTFHRAEPPTPAELTDLIATLRTRILCYLERRGLLDSDSANTDPLNDEAPVCWRAVTQPRSLADKPWGAAKAQSSSASAPTRTRRGSNLADHSKRNSMALICTPR